MTPGSPLLGARNYEEVASGVAMDHAEISSLSAGVRRNAGWIEPKVSRPSP